MNQRTMPHIAHFGIFEADLRSHELRKRGVRVKLQEQPFQVLATLLEHPGEVVSREELRRRIWPSDTFVDFDNGLNGAVNRLREALGDSADSPRFVETLPRQGYRFLATVEDATGVVIVRQPGLAGVYRWLLVALVASVRERSQRFIWAAGAVALLLAAGLLLWRLREPSPQPGSKAAAAAPVTIAVLPFQNLGGDKEEDFLRMALPDEIATTLSSVRTLSIRPFSTTTKYAAADVDVQQAGKAMHVGRIVMGHYQKVRDQMQLTMQAVDVADERVLWQDTMNVPVADLVAMREQVTSKVRQGLIPALGATNAPGENGTRPTNEEAYDLYLRSVALAHDGDQNREAIRMLERSVGLDSQFAPAWSALGKRYYYEEEYGPGATGTMSRTVPTLRRALALDPDLEDAAAQIVSLDTDAGKLAQAYQEAKGMVDRRPQSGFAHFTLSYVLRYANLTKEAADECNAAVRLDPGNYQFRSCAVVLLSTGQYDRARDFLKLDAGSEWSNNVEAVLLLREGKKSQALERLRQLPESSFFNTRALEACYSTPRPPGAQQLFEQAQKNLFAYRDPEPKYSQAVTFNPCLGNDFTARLVKSAIEGGFCAYDYLQLDAGMAEFRKSPQYPAVLAQAKQCRDRFLAERNQPQH